MLKPSEGDGERQEFYPTAWPGPNVRIKGFHSQYSTNYEKFKIMAMVNSSTWIVQHLD
jgi:hypothetical protein